MNDRLKRILQHIPVGVGNIGVFLFNPYAGILFGVGYLTYQLTQAIHYRFKDKAWQDIAGWLWGLAIAGIIWVLIDRLS